MAPYSAHAPVTPRWHLAPGTLQEVDENKAAMRGGIGRLGRLAHGLANAASGGSLDTGRLLWNAAAPTLRDAGRRLASTGAMGVPTEVPVDVSAPPSPRITALGQNVSGNFANPRPALAFTPGAMMQPEAGRRRPAGLPIAAPKPAPATVPNVVPGPAPIPAPAAIPTQAPTGRGIFVGGKAWNPGMSTVPDLAPGASEAEIQTRAVWNMSPEERAAVDTPELRRTIRSVQWVGPATATMVTPGADGAPEYRTPMGTVGARRSAVLTPPAEGSGVVTWPGTTNAQNAAAAEAYRAGAYGPTNVNTLAERPVGQGGGIGRAYQSNLNNQGMLRPGERGVSNRERELFWMAQEAARTAAEGRRPFVMQGEEGEWAVGPDGRAVPARVAGDLPERRLDETERATNLRSVDADLVALRKAATDAGSLPDADNNVVEAEIAKQRLLDPENDYEPNPVHAQWRQRYAEATAAGDETAKAAAIKGLRSTSKWVKTPAPGSSGTIGRGRAAAGDYGKATEPEGTTAVKRDAKGNIVARVVVKNGRWTAVSTK